MQLLIQKIRWGSHSVIVKDVVLLYLEDHNSYSSQFLAELSKKLARTAGLFYYKIRHYAATETLILRGISPPFLSYGLPVWGSTYPSMLDPITVLQKRILKIVTFNWNHSTIWPLFDSFQILKLNDLFQLQVASFVYELMHQLSCSDLFQKLFY